jgi:hypothetical protein
MLSLFFFFASAEGKSFDGRCGIFCVKFFLLQYLKKVKICRNCVWLCDFMFCNTYILFFELFMCKVLGLKFFNYKLMIYFLIFFGLGSKLETDLVSQPPTPLVHLIWLKRINNGQRLGRNGSVNLSLALSHIVPNGCWPNICRRCMAWW